MSVQRLRTGVPQDLGILKHFLQNGLLEPHEFILGCFSSKEAEHRASPGTSCRKLSPVRSCHSCSGTQGCCLCQQENGAFPAVGLADVAPVSAAARLPHSSPCP